MIFLVQLHFHCIIITGNQLLSLTDINVNYYPVSILLEYKFQLLHRV